MSEDSLLMNGDEIPGPVWIDRCRHVPSTYVGSFVTYNKGSEGKYDLYVYFGDLEAAENQNTCIRYGNHGWEYLSPGPLYQLVQLANHGGGMDAYKAAFELLRKKGRIAWIRKEGK